MENRPRRRFRRHRTADLHRLSLSRSCSSHTDRFPPLPAGRRGSIDLPFSPSVVIPAGRENMAAADRAGGWRREEDKAFEDALAAALPASFEEEEGEGRGREMTTTTTLWEEIAAKVPGGRTAAEVRHHYETLVEDVRAIEAGKVPLPCYRLLGKEKDRERERQTAAQDGVNIKKGSGAPPVLCGGGGGGGLEYSSGGGGHHVIRSTSTSKAEQERRKGIPWTEEEHKLFLLGLDKYGKGDWRSISRNFVVSRTPTQVASHAQKYFIRLNAMNRDRRRASIHDITSVVHSNGDAAANNSPITGQTMSPAAARTAVHPQPAMPAVAMYRAAAAAIGQPAAAAGHAVAAVGTPILRPPAGHPPYIIPVAYPVLPSTMHP